MIFFISGGSRGLGRAMVLAAARAGHAIAFTFRADAEAAAATQREAKAAGAAECRAYRLDVRDSNAVDEVAEEVLDAFGGVDAIVPNAGITRNGMAATMSDDAWREVLDTNLSGAFYVARAFLSTMIAQRSGRIIFISSIARDGIAGQVNYSASKAGLIGMAKAIGKEYGARGLTANVLVPGFFDTDMTRASMSDHLKEFADAVCPAKRMGEVDELAAALLFLASPAAAFINCAVLPVTGGLDWSI